MTADVTSAVAREIEHDCARLVLRFAELVDSGRYEQLSQLFAANGAFYHQRTRTTDDGGCSHRLIPPAFGTECVMHVATNVLITAESRSTASGSARILFFGALRDAVSEVGKGRKATMQLVGRFSDRFVRTAQGWRFAERRGEMLFNV